VQYRHPLRWQVSDFDYPVEHLEGSLRVLTQNSPWSLNKTNVLYEWDANARRLGKRTVGSSQETAA
jgi:hypothetical protein